MVNGIVRGGIGRGTLSFIASLAEQDVWGLRPELDTTTDGKYDHNGVDAMLFELSIGQGKGSTKVQIDGSEFCDVASLLGSFDPDAEESDEELSALECIRRTLKRDGENVTFKVSLAKHSRSVSVPVGTWPDFVKLFADWSADLVLPDGSSGPAVEKCREVVRQVLEQEAAARAKVRGPGTK